MLPEGVSVQRFVKLAMAFAFVVCFFTFVILMVFPFVALEAALGYSYFVCSAYMLIIWEW